jgi:hypothetical protein
MGLVSDLHSGMGHEARPTAEGIMTRDEIMDRWRQRLSDWTQLQTTVNGEQVAIQVLADLKAMAEASDDAQIGLTDAAQESGYSTRQLSRMIEDGTLKNVGRPNAPKLLRKELPKKAVRSSVRTATGVSLRLARQAVASKRRVS